MSILKEVTEFVFKRLNTLEQRQLELRIEIRDAELKKDVGEWLGGGSYMAWQNNVKEHEKLKGPIAECESLLAEFRGRLRK